MGSRQVARQGGSRHTASSPRRGRGERIQKHRRRRRPAPQQNNNNDIPLAVNDNINNDDDGLVVSEVESLEVNNLQVESTSNLAATPLKRRTIVILLMTKQMVVVQRMNLLDKIVVAVIEVNKMVVMKVKRMMLILPEIYLMRL